MFHEKGHMKEVAFASGTLTIMLMGNPLKLTQQERELVFTLVDQITEFEKNQAHPVNQMSD